MVVAKRSHYIIYHNVCYLFLFTGGETWQQLKDRVVQVYHRIAVASVSQTSTYPSLSSLIPRSGDYLKSTRWRNVKNTAYVLISYAVHSYCIRHYSANVHKHTQLQFSIVS